MPPSRKTNRRFPQQRGNLTMSGLKTPLAVVADILGIGTVVMAIVLYLQGTIGIHFVIFLSVFGLFLTIIFMEARVISGNLQSIKEKIDTMQPIQQGYEEKFEKMKEKYKQVEFKAVNSINEFTANEANAVKIGLIRGVQHSVYAIYRVETYLPLPMDPLDDKNYFKANKKALDRIRKNHPSHTEVREYTIHRIFVIAREVLDDPDKVERIRSKVEEHCKAGFNVRIALKEDLGEPPAYEFAIYDKEICLRLGVNQPDRRYGEGTVYFDDAVLRDVYMRRYRDIEAESDKPEDFWSKDLEKPDARNQ